MSCPNNLTAKKFFRDTFNIPVAELNQFFRAERVLYRRVKRQEAEQFQKVLQAIGGKTDLIQTGISYRGKFTDDEIIAALTCSGNKLTDFIIDCKEAHYFMSDMALIIEDEDLSNACFAFLLRFGAPIADME